MQHHLARSGEPTEHVARQRRIPIRPPHPSVGFERMEPLGQRRIVRTQRPEPRPGPHHNTPEGYTYEFSGSVEDPNNPKRDRGNSGVNRPNAFTLSTTYGPIAHFGNKVANAIVGNNLFAFLGDVESGDEQTITTSTHLNGDSTSTSRPLYIGRNTVRAPSVYQFDLRYTRTLANLWNRVQPSIFIESNNLANHVNVVTVNAVATTNSAGVITTQPTFAPTGASPLEARILQFGARFNF